MSLSLGIVYTPWGGAILGAAISRSRMKDGSASISVPGTAGRRSPALPRSRRESLALNSCSVSAKSGNGIGNFPSWSLSIRIPSPALIFDEDDCRPWLDCSCLGILPGLASLRPRRAICLWSGLSHPMLTSIRARSKRHRPKPPLYRLDTLCGRAPKVRRLCWRKNVEMGEYHGPKSVKPSLPPCISLLWDDAIEANGFRVRTPGFLTICGEIGIRIACRTNPFEVRGRVTGGRFATAVCFPKFGTR